MAGGAPSRGPSPIPQVVAVVALVAAAALALEARRGLDWDSLAEPLDPRWSRLVVGGLLLLVLVAFVRRLLHRLRRPRLSPGTSNPLVEPEGEQMPWWLRVMAFALVLATLWAVFFVLSSLGPIPRPQIDPPASPEGDPGDGIVDALGDRGTSSSVAFAVLAVLLGGALAYGWLARRTGPKPEEAGAAAGDVGVEVAQLSAAVEAAGDELARHADPRQAVLAAYAAMARHLATGLVHRGRISRTSDTATELLDRAVDAGLVTGAPARTLTDLFREARFSRHPMGEEARQAAEESLAQVRAELRVRRG